MLRGNGTYLNLNAGRLRGGGAAPISQGNYQKVGASRGVALQELETAAKPLIGYPTGYSGAGWFMPIKGGELTSLYNTDFSLSGSATGVLGKPAIGEATLGIAAEATGGLIASGEGSATFGISTNNPLLTASLNAVGSTTFGMTTNTPLLGAIASGTGSAEFGIDGALTSYAIGIMEGTTAEQGVTVDNVVAGVWNAALADYPTAGSAGKTLATAASGGVDYDALAAAVWDTLEADMNTAGSAGDKLKKLLTTIQFLGLK